MEDTKEGTGRQWEGGSGNGERRETLLGSMMKGTEGEGMRGQGGANRRRGNEERQRGMERERKKMMRKEKI